MRDAEFQRDWDCRMWIALEKTYSIFFLYNTIFKLTLNPVFVYLLFLLSILLANNRDTLSFIRPEISSFPSHSPSDLFFLSPRNFFRLLLLIKEYSAVFCLLYLHIRQSAHILCFLNHTPDVTFLPANFSFNST